MIDFSNSVLYELSNKKYLSELFKIELYKLKSIEQYYTTNPFERKTKNGKIRTLYNPSADYKNVLHRINRYLQMVTLPNYVLGGIKKRDYVMNAKIHKESSYFLLLDIANFFPSTKDKYVYNFFRKKMLMEPDIAKICTLLTTEKNTKNTHRILPQGYPTSPLLSYFCYFDMYNGIYNLSKEKGINFSCYYDDLTFSSSTYIPKVFKNKIIKIINTYELNVNMNKTRLLKNDKGLKITGTVIRNNNLLAPNKLQLKLKDNYKKLLHLYKNKPNEIIQMKKIANTVKGCISAIQKIEPQRQFPHIENLLRDVRSHVNERGNCVNKHSSFRNL